MVLIRPVLPSDRDAVMALAPRLCVGVARWRPLDRVRAVATGWVADALDRAGPTAPVWVSEADGEVVGFVAAATVGHWSGQTDAYVGELAVAPGHSGQGIGRMLMEQAEAWARERGLGRLRLETGWANTGARGFYEAIGYEVEEVVLSRAL